MRAVYLRLTEEQMQYLEEACATWLPQTVGHLQASWAAGSYKASVEERVDAMGEHCRDSLSWHGIELQSLGGERWVFNPGKFWSRIQANWSKVGAKKPKNSLTKQQMQYLEEACSAWLPRAVQKLQVRLETDSYKPSVPEKVQALGHHFPQAAPKWNEKVGLQATRGQLWVFKAGTFWYKIKANWIDAKDKVYTKLTYEQMRYLEEACTWLQTAIENMRSEQSS